MHHFVLLMVFAALGVEAKEIRAGVAKVEITPAGSIWMSGYAARTKASEGVGQKLWAKAVALEQPGKGKVVVVTTDLIGLPRTVTDVVSARLGKEYNLDRASLLFNSSHTHSGPVVTPNLMTMYFLDGEQTAAVNAYRDRLIEDLVSVVGAALKDLAPAKLSKGHGKAGFAINRRKALNPNGPSDHDVPVIAVRGMDGKLRAVLFAYACHNTTLGGDHYQINGDYAGFAQEEIERLQPGAVGLFLLLCGGDQNPNPRGTVAHASQYGKELAGEVNRLLGGPMEEVKADLKVSYRVVNLAFAPHTKEQFEEEAKHTDRFRVSRAKQMLRDYERGRPVRGTPYPVQAVRLGKGFVLLALGGEVVVDYALRTKKEYGKTDVVVAGYSNDVMCYIPSLRVLREGGYEGETSMIYYGMPGKFTEEVEETVFTAIHAVMAGAGVKR